LNDDDKIMNKKCILISGPTIARDPQLGNEIQKNAIVLKISDNREIFPILKNRKVELILLEIINEYLSDIDLIKNIKSKFPEILIVLIDGNGNRNLIAKAFEYGVKDAFKSPLRYDLIEERVRGLLNYKRKFKTATGESG
jgi:PleD family two-component response regulator